MYCIGIDVGSAYTKYCIMADGVVKELYEERTPVRQRDYFDKKISSLAAKHDGAGIVSCGYGKKNVDGMRQINELSALAAGCHYLTGRDGLVLDIGGQDTKIIFQEGGQLREFFINDKCAAGSGMFLTNTLEMLGVRFEDVVLEDTDGPSIGLSSVCAVFAQSEIVELIADNRTENEIISAVIRQILVKAKPLVAKMEVGPILISGGLSMIKDMDVIASRVLDRECGVIENGTYVAAIGCAIRNNKGGENER